MSKPVRHWTNSLAGILIGAVVLVFATAILTGAVSSVRAEDKAAKLSSQVTGLRADNAALRSDNATLRAQVTALGNDNKALRKQVAALVKYLREQGIEVPQTLADRGGGSSGKGQAPSGAPNHPKPKPSPQPSPTPASPEPTATPSPTGSPGLADVICSLLPPSVPCQLP